MSIPRNPYYGTYIHDCDAGEGMVPRWPHKDAVTDFKMSLPAFVFLCRFNGVDRMAAPASWMYAPNEWCREFCEKWAKAMVEEQNDYIAWSRKPGQSGKPYPKG